MQNNQVSKARLQSDANLQTNLPIQHLYPKANFNYAENPTKITKSHISKRKRHSEPDNCPDHTNLIKIEHILPELGGDDIVITVQIEIKTPVDISYALFLYEMIQKLLPGVSSIKKETILNPSVEDVPEINRLAQMLKLRGILAQNTKIHNFLVDNLNEKIKINKNADDYDKQILKVQCETIVTAIKNGAIGIKKIKDEYYRLLNEQKNIYE
ncbi:hypothetical protein COBT_000710 [Conglomerata obtusa]